MSEKDTNIKPMSEEEKWTRYSIDIMVNSAFLPGGYYSYAFQSNDNKVLRNERFSTNYKTEEEFQADKRALRGYIERKEYAPKRLADRVIETVRELDDWAYHIKR